MFCEGSLGDSELHRVDESIVMSKGPLKRLRESLGFTSHEVAQRARWSPKRQLELEASADVLDCDEALILEVVLGVDLDAVLEGRAVKSPLAALLKGQASELSAQARFGLTEATSVALEVQRLRALLGDEAGLGVVGDFQANGDYGHPDGGVPENLASFVYKQLKLHERGDVPLSMMQDVLAPLGVVVLWQPALPPSIDAVALASDATGAVIVANPRGAHMATAEGRRITFAHELCHLLFDRPEMHRFSRACKIEGLTGQERDWFGRVERRARAFAPALLAPRAALKHRWESTSVQKTEARVRDIMHHFGMSYSATRAHLHNMGLYSLQQQLEPPRQAPEGSPWDTIEPLPQPPEEGDWLRGLALGPLIERALERDLVSRRWAQECLRGPLAEPIAWVPHERDGVGFETTSNMARR